MGTKSKEHILILQDSFKYLKEKDDNLKNYKIITHYLTLKNLILKIILFDTSSNERRGRENHHLKNSKSILESIVDV